MIIPIVYSALGVISLPSSPMTFPISNIDNMQAILMNSDEKAKSFPGHILQINVTKRR